MRAIRWSAWVLGVVAVVGAWTGGALAASPEQAAGRLLWQDRFGQDDYVVAVAVEKGRVFVAGSAGNLSGGSDLFIRAYDTQTGAMLWSDRMSSGFVEAIAVDAGRVFVVGGTWFDGSRSALLVRAYLATNGILLWEDRFDPIPGHNAGKTVAASGGRVFVGGYAASVPGNEQFIVRAYEAGSGRVLWQDFETRLGGGAVQAILADGARAYAGGCISGNCVVRAYDVRRGTLRWESHEDANSIEALTLSGGRIVFGGSRVNRIQEFLVRSRRALDGALLWSRSEEFGLGSFARGVVAQGSIVVAGGTGTNSSWPRYMAC